MAVINVVIEEDELTCRITNDFGQLYSILRNALYSESTDPCKYNSAYLQLAHSVIDSFNRFMEIVPNVQVYKEKFNEGVLDAEHCEVVTYTSEHEDYPKLLLASLCNRYKEVLTALIMAASEDIQTNVTNTFYFTSGDSYGWHHEDSASVVLQMLTDVRQFVIKYLISDVTVYDYIINVAPLLIDSNVSELIWKRYMKHCAKLRYDIAINQLVVGKMMVVKELDHFAKLLDDTFEFVTSDASIDLNESSILYYKMNPCIKDKIVFEHRLGPYAQALFRNETQAILSTPVIDGSIDKNANKFGFRSKFIPVNIPTGEALTDAKCEGLLAKFAS